MCLSLFICLDRRQDSCLHLRVLLNEPRCFNLLLFEFRLLRLLLEQLCLLFDMLIPHFGQR